MSCFACSQLSERDQNVIKYYKELYTKYGKEYYVYRLNTNEGVKFIEKNQFNTIFINQIKPNFQHGAEYFHISEFQE